jgi:hypothetical protein
MWLKQIKKELFCITFGLVNFLSSAHFNQIWSIIVKDCTHCIQSVFIHLSPPLNSSLLEQNGHI